MSQERVKRRSLVETVGRSVAHIPHYVFQKNPYLPDILNQPEFLLVPELGRLVAVYVYTPNIELSWRSALPAIEDLFEIKLSSGESTTAIAVLVPPKRLEEVDNIFVEFLRNLFDGIVINVAENQSALVNSIAEIVASSRPRADLFRLWRLERQRVTTNLHNFNEERYARFANERNISQLKKKAALREVRAILSQNQDVTLLERYKVRSPKEPLAGLPERNRFEFDLGIKRSSVGRTRPIDVAVLGRYGSRTKLRYLMTKARLTSYEPWRGELRLRHEFLRPVLVVSGNIAGPSHDPYRYVRALVSVGWEIVEATPESVREVANGDF